MILYLSKYLCIVEVWHKEWKQIAKRQNLFDYEFCPNQRSLVWWLPCHFSRKCNQLIDEVWVEGRLFWPVYFLSSAGFASEIRERCHWFALLVGNVHEQLYNQLQCLWLHHSFSDLSNLRNLFLSILCVHRSELKHFRKKTFDVLVNFLCCQEWLTLHVFSCECNALQLEQFSTISMNHHIEMKVHSLMVLCNREVPSKEIVLSRHCYPQEFCLPLSFHNFYGWLMQHFYVV